MWVVMRERESVENVFFSFFFYLFQYFFKREIKEKVCVGVVMGKNQRNVENPFFGHDRVRIYTHTLQYQCNLSLHCNGQYKEGISYDSSKLWESEHKINHYQ